MKLTFLGGAGEVTGSAHLISTGRARVLRDCGTVQGRRSESDAKNRSLAARAGRLDCIVISHAHLDHCGNTPALVREGFRGGIAATPATADLLPVLWADSAHIQESDLKFLVKQGGFPIEPEPLYTQADVDQAAGQIFRCGYAKPRELAPGIEVEFLEAGHILGSALNRITVRDGERTRRLGFAVDLGRRGVPILRDPATLDGIDTLVIESTYGARVHEGVADLEQRFAGLLKKTFNRGGKVIIPAFALGRAQEVLYSLKRLYDTGQVTRVPVFLDSPLAGRVTEVFRSHFELYDDEARRIGHAFLAQNFVNIIASKEQSQELNNLQGPAIIISASGMCESGRILHHLRHHLGGRANLVLIVGFQAAGTLGRKLLDGFRNVNLFGQPHQVNAEIAKLNGFSAHAGQDDLLGCIRAAGPALERVFFVHGEPTQIETLVAKAREVTKAECLVPAFGQEYVF